MVMLYVGNEVAPAATGMKSESNPTWPVVALFNFLHGSAKVDCVAVWFLVWNSKTIVSRGKALTNEGLNVRVLFPPTMTLITLPSKLAGVGAGEFGYEP